MKVSAKQTVEMEATAIRIVVPVRYEDEDMPNDYPHRKGDVWDVTVDIETGQIRDWPAGTKAMDLDMKVCDEGVYTLLGADGNEIAKIDQNYVPNCIPERYGDYIEFKIDGNGRVTNWNMDAEALSACFFGDDE